MAFTSGPYLWYWGGTALGVVEEPPRLEITHRGQPINADFMGGGVIDHIYQSAEVTMEIIFQEFNRPAILTAGDSLLQNLSISHGGTGAVTAQNRIGTPISINQADVLRGSAVITGQLTTPDNILIRRAGIAVDSPTSFLYGTQLRNVAMRFNLYPYEFPIDSGNFYFFENYTKAIFDGLATPDDRTLAYSVQEALNA